MSLRRRLGAQCSSGEEKVNRHHDSSILAASGSCCLLFLQLSVTTEAVGHRPSPVSRQDKNANWNQRHAQCKGGDPTCSKDAPSAIMFRGVQGRRIQTRPFLAWHQLSRIPSPKTGTSRFPGLEATAQSRRPSLSALGRRPPSASQEESHGTKKHSHTSLAPVRRDTSS